MMSTIEIKPRTFSWVEAAQILGISRHALLRELKDRKIIHEDRQFGPMPENSHISSGFFTTEIMLTYINGVIPKHYRKTRVTVQGLAWIEKTLKESATIAA